METAVHTSSISTEFAFQYLQLQEWNGNGNLKSLGHCQYISDFWGLFLHESSCNDQVLCGETTWFLVHKFWKPSSMCMIILSGLWKFHFLSKTEYKWRQIKSRGYFASSSPFVHFENEYYYHSSSEARGEIQTCACDKCFGNLSNYSAGPSADCLSIVLFAPSHLRHRRVVEERKSLAQIFNKSCASISWVWESLLF